MTTKEQ